MQMRPVSFWARASASASARLSATGISICTCLPERRHWMPCCACICVGVARMAASTPGCARHSSSRVDQCGMRYFCATSRVESALPPASVTISMPGIFWMASMCLMPNAPWPAMQIFKKRLLSGGLEAQQARGGVRGGHVVEAIGLAYPVAERAAHREPHDHLDALGAGLAHVLRV